MTIFVRTWVINYQKYFRLQKLQRMRNIQRLTIWWEESVFLEFNSIFLCADKINTFDRRRIDLVFIKSEIEMLTSEHFLKQPPKLAYQFLFHHLSESKLCRCVKSQMITHVKLEWLLFEMFFFLIEDELICVQFIYWTSKKTIQKADWMYRKKLRIKIQCFYIDLKPFYRMLIK